MDFISLKDAEEQRQGYSADKGINKHCPAEQTPANKKNRNVQHQVRYRGADVEKGIKQKCNTCKTALSQIVLHIEMNQAK